MPVRPVHPIKACAPIEVTGLPSIVSGIITSVALLLLYLVIVTLSSETLYVKSPSVVVSANTVVGTSISTIQRVSIILKIRFFIESSS